MRGRNGRVCRLVVRGIMPHDRPLAGDVDQYHKITFGSQGSEYFDSCRLLQSIWGQFIDQGPDDAVFQHLVKTQQLGSIRTPGLGPCFATIP